MANIKELVFQKQDNGGPWVSSFTSEGECIIEVERETDGSPIVVYANISGMRPVVVSSLSPTYSRDCIFKLEIPAGIEVTISSTAEVVSAKMFSE